MYLCFCRNVLCQHSFWKLGSNKPKYINIEEAGIRILAYFLVKITNSCHLIDYSVNCIGCSVIRKKQLSALLTVLIDTVLSAPAHHIVNSVHVNWSCPEFSDVTAADCSLTTDDKRLLWHHWLGRGQDYSAFSEWTWNWNLKVPSWCKKKKTAVSSRIYLRDKKPPSGFEIFICHRGGGAETEELWW